MVKEIKSGRIKLEKATVKKDIYLLWDENSDTPKRKGNFILKLAGPILHAPKPPLPGHAESYNPPPEYLYTEEELKNYQEKEEFPHNFTPQRYESLRKVPGYVISKT